jgi:hypothetical protein
MLIQVDRYSAHRPLHKPMVKDGEVLEGSGGVGANSLEDVDMQKLLFRFC